MFQPGCLTLLVVFSLLALFPFFLAHLMVAALAKLGLHPQVALLVLIGILFGGPVNIPIKRIPREEELLVDPWGTSSGSQPGWPASAARELSTALSFPV